MFPDTGKAVVRCCAVSGSTWSSRGADVLRAADGQHRLPRRGGAGGADLRRRVRGVRRHRHAVGVVRRLARGTSTRSSRDRSGDPALVAAVAETAPRTYELSEFLVDVLGVTDVGAYFPHRVTYHPTCHSLRMLGVGDRPRPAARGGPRHRAGRPPRADRVLRLRRHLRGQERRHVGRDGRRQGPPRPRHRRRGAGRRRQLLPDAHRRHALAPAGRRTRHAPRRDPRGHEHRGPRPAPLVGTRSESETGHRRPSSACRPSRPPRARRWPTPSCATTSPTPPAPSAPSAPPWSPRSRTGRSCGSRARRSRRPRCATSPPTSRRSRRR